MNSEYASSMPFSRLSFLKDIRDRRVPLAFSLELTARCNNNCRHCGVNLPQYDPDAISKELSLSEIEALSAEAASMGALGCLLTGGEPLLRDDFFEIYMSLKRQGLLITVFTNACLITEEHVDLFRRYPPKRIEVTVYGATEETYEKITRRKGSFAAFQRGLGLLRDGGVGVRLKAMAVRSNLHEFPKIAGFCTSHTEDYFRLDPFLHLRSDGDAARNLEILSERLSPDEIVELECSDKSRGAALSKECEKISTLNDTEPWPGKLFHCDAGNKGFHISYDGFFRLCISLSAPWMTYDLRRGSLLEAWTSFAPMVRDIESHDPEFDRTCKVCPIINLCVWCPAHAYQECGEVDQRVDYFCRVARTRVSKYKGIDCSKDR